MSPIDVIREARQLGFDRADVSAAVAEVRAVERERRQRPNEVRSTAWMMAVASTPGSWPFWRHGFRSRWGRKIEQGHDYTIVPGYDEIGQQIGTAFPEYADDDGTERLFDFLFSDYDRLPDRETVYRKALDLLEREVTP